MERKLVLRKVPNEQWFSMRIPVGSAIQFGITGLNNEPYITIEETDSDEVEVINFYRPTVGLPLVKAGDAYLWHYLGTFYFDRVYFGLYII